MHKSSPILITGASGMIGSALLRRLQGDGYLVPRKSVFNRIVGDSQLELEFAAFLEDCTDIISYAKNYFAVNFKLD